MSPDSGGSSTVPHDGQKGHGIGRRGAKESGGLFVFSGYRTTTSNAGKRARAGVLLLGSVESDSGLREKLARPPKPPGVSLWPHLDTSTSAVGGVVG